MPDIRFGNIDFSGDGAYIWGAGQYSAPTRSVDFIKVPGRNGDLVIDNGNYNNIKARFSVVITRDVEKNTDRLKYLLYSQRGYQRLYDSDMKGFYRMACFSDGFDISSTKAGVVDIEFDCKPFKYDIFGEQDIELTETDKFHEIENPYFENSMPIITVYGNGKNNLIVNNSVILVDLSFWDKIIIDTEMKYAYDDGLNLSKYVSTADFYFHPGKNSIFFQQGITKVEVKPRWVTI